MAFSSTYTQTYTSFGGCDIVAVFGNIIVGELQAIQYHITREKAPIYTLGSPDPRSFSRGKRGIAGSLVFVVFDKDALLQAMKTGYSGTFGYTGPGGTKNLDGTWNDSALGINNWNSAATGAYSNGGVFAPFEELSYDNAMYADQLPPIDITVAMANEYGHRAKLVIRGVEILNEGMGVSIDDVVTEKACTFVCRRIEALTPDRDDLWEGRTMNRGDNQFNANNQRAVWGGLSNAQ